MYIPYQTSVGASADLPTLIANARVAFEKVIKAFEHSARCAEYFVDITTTKFSFEITPTGHAEAVLEDYTDN